MQGMADLHARESVKAQLVQFWEKGVSYLSPLLIQFLLDINEQCQKMTIDLKAWYDNLVEEREEQDNNNVE